MHLASDRCLFKTVAWFDFMSKNCRENLAFGKNSWSLNKCLYLWQFIIHLELQPLKVMKPSKWYWSIITFRANMKFNMCYWEYFTPGCSTSCSSKRGKGCKLCSAMGNTNSITNKLTKNRLLHLEINATPLTPYTLQNPQSMMLFMFVIAHTDWVEDSTVTTRISKLNKKPVNSLNTSMKVKILK